MPLTKDKQPIRINRLDLNNKMSSKLRCAPQKNCPRPLLYCLFFSRIKLKYDELPHCLLNREQELDRLAINIVKSKANSRVEADIHFR